MTQSVANSRRKPPRNPFDLALIETVNASINAARDVLRAARALKAAREGNAPGRVYDAERAYHNATDKAAVAKSNLGAALALEAEARA